MFEVHLETGTRARAMFILLLCLAFITAVGATGDSHRYSYADMYYHVETVNETTAEMRGESQRWWERRAPRMTSEHSMVQLAMSYSSGYRTYALNESFTMDFFGIKGGLGVGFSPFLAPEGFLSMTPYNPCSVEQGSSRCETLTFSSGRVTEAECRRNPELNNSVRHATPSVPQRSQIGGGNGLAPPPFDASYKAFRRRNVGVPWTVVSLFAEPALKSNAAWWTDATHRCVLFRLRTQAPTAGSPYVGDGLSGEVELCRNGTVTLRYESVPSIPEEGRAAALRRCLALAASNATDPAFVLEPFVGLSANEHMAISLPPPRWVTTAGPNGTTTRRLTVTAYRITPRHLLPDEGFDDATKPAQSLRQCSRRAQALCGSHANNTQCVWCFGARRTDDDLTLGNDVGSGRCMHFAEAAKFCPPYQTADTHCDVVQQLKVHGIRYVQTVVVRPSACEFPPSSGAGDRSFFPGFGECQEAHGRVRCGTSPLAWFKLAVASQSDRRPQLPLFDATTQQRLAHRDSMFFEWSGAVGRIGAVAGTPSGGISISYCANQRKVNGKWSQGPPSAGFIPNGNVLEVGVTVRGYRQYVENAELHVVAGVTISFVPVDEWALCPDVNVTLPPCPVGYAGPTCVSCAAGYVIQGGVCLLSPRSDPSSASQAVATGDDGAQRVDENDFVGSTLMYLLLALLIVPVFACIWIIVSLARCRACFGERNPTESRTAVFQANATVTRTGELRFLDDARAGDHDDETPGSFQVYRDAFAPLLATAPVLGQHRGAPKAKEWPRRDPLTVHTTSVAGVHQEEEADWSSDVSL